MREPLPTGSNSANGAPFRGYGLTMQRVRTALYLDFDNVFSGLMKLDPAAAVAFADKPRVWLDRLADTLLVDGPRRWLVVRCYLNPGGSVSSPGPDAANGRIYFSRFRPSFTDAGFDVVDCPRLAHTKNAADIRMVVDALDALSGATHYDEFIIASGDSDMTPLLVRLRAADRRTVIMSPSDAVEALASVADRLVNGQELLELLEDETDELAEELAVLSDTDPSRSCDALRRRTSTGLRPVQGNRLGSVPDISDAGQSRLPGL